MVLHSLADYYRNLNKTDNLMRELELILGENITKDDFVHSEAFPDDSMDIVMAFYKELTEDEQLLISLKYKYRYTSKEIAEIIGISPSLVRMRLSRIIEKIRKHVNDNLE